MKRRAVPVLSSVPALHPFCPPSPPPPSSPLAPPSSSPFPDLWIACVSVHWTKHSHNNVHPPTHPAAAPAAPAPAAAAPPPPPPPPAAAAPAPAAAAPAAPVLAPRADGRVIATPYAKQLAKDLRVDLATVAGTGPSGRITASDVERTAKGGAAPAAAPAAAVAAAPAAAAAAPAAAAPASAKAVAGTTVSELRGTTKPFTSLQGAVARNMNESLKVRVSISVYVFFLGEGQAAVGEKRDTALVTHAYCC